MSRKKESINVRLLIDTLSVQTESNNDTEMMYFIKNFLITNGVSYKEDAYGNIYATKGAGPYAAFVAHTDTVHKVITDFRVFKAGSILFGFNGSTGKQYGIGGDDKCGVFCNLQALIDFRAIKAVFFRNEEIGCLGSNKADLSFFDDCNFAIQFDRRGKGDLITEVGSMPLCSKTFLAAINPYMTKYGYKTCFGSSTDVATLKRNGLAVSTVNISSGYFEPHTDNEIVNIVDLDNGYRMVKDIILNLGKTKFDHVYTPPRITIPTYAGYGEYDEDVYADYYSKAFSKSSIALYKNFAYAHRSTPKVFKYIGRDPVSLSEINCPVCHSRECLYFLPDALEFYCTTDNVYIHNPGTLFKELVVNDRLHNVSTEISFVFDWTCFSWYKKHDAVWVKELNTYKLKDK